MPTAAPIPSPLGGPPRTLRRRGVDCLRLLVLFFVPVLVLGGVPDTPSAYACSCASLRREQLLATSDLVFVGTVLSARDPHAGAASLVGTDPLSWTFAVERLDKGPRSPRIEVLSPRDPAACGVPFSVGQRYEVFAQRAGAGWQTGLCSGTNVVDAKTTAGAPTDLPSWGWRAGGVVALGALASLLVALGLARNGVRLRARVRRHGAHG